MRLSIALCTYRGARHLPRQLGSLLEQQRAPDEVVVSDDGSTDGTLEILERFAREAPFPVDVRVNAERLGSTTNFDRTFERCSGDVILPCDQDDEWHPEKLREIERTFADRPTLGLAFSDATLVDGASTELGLGLWDSLEVPARSWRRFRSGAPRDRVEVLCRKNLVTGTTMAFHARFRPLVLPIPPEWVHDAWVALLLAAVADVEAIADPLVRYRVHGGQQIGTRVVGRWDRARRRVDAITRPRARRRPDFGEQARAFGEAHARLEEPPAGFRPPVGPLEVLAAKVRHARVRERVMGTRRRWRVVASELGSGRYHRFSSGLASAARDLLVPR